MDKTLWTALAALWIMVCSAAVFGATGLNTPVANASISTEQAMVLPATPAVAVTELNVASTLHRPTYVLGAANRPEAIGLVLGTLFAFARVTKRRPI